MTISIDKIQCFKGSQHNAFEELACQIAKRTLADCGSKWTRLEGSGGDGGIEAYWLCDDQQHGVQAKFVSKFKDPQQRQIMSSFKRALAVHPDLSHYHVFISINLSGSTKSDATNPSSRKSGHQRWAEIEARMLEHARDEGRNVKVLLYTESDIIDCLSDPRCLGLAYLWFGEYSFDQKTLNSMFESAKAALGQRYNPTLHVSVSEEKIIDGQVSDEKIISELEEQLLMVGKRRKLVYAEKLCDTKMQSLLDSTEQLLVKTADELKKLTSIAPLRTNLSKCRERCKEIKRNCEKLSKYTYFSKPNKYSHYDSIWYDLKDTINRIQTILEILNSETAIGTENQFVCLIGPGGIGKTQLLANRVQKELCEGGTAIFLLGSWFDNSNIEKTILERTGNFFGRIEDLLANLNALSERNRRRGLIVIDGINESTNVEWKRELPSILSKLKRYENLAFTISCRDIYEKYYINDEVSDFGKVVSMSGFSSESQQAEATKLFLTNKGITVSSLQWLTPEFANPLMLKLLSLSLNTGTLKEFPNELIGIDRIISYYISSVARSFGCKYDGTAELENAIRDVYWRFSLEILKRHRDSLDSEQTCEIVSNAFGMFSGSEVWLDLLCDNGVIDRIPADNDSESEYTPVEYRFRIPHQRVSDLFIADHLIRSYSSVGELLDNKNKFNFLLDEQNNVNWEWIGVVECLCIKLPEKFGIEFPYLVTSIVRRTAPVENMETAFLNSVRWRKSKSVTKKTLEFVNSIELPAYELYSLAVECALRDHHLMNANHLHTHLSRMKIAIRDSRWTVAISWHYENGTFDRFLSWCLESNKSSLNTRYLERCGIVLGWMTSSTNLKVRNDATRALAALYVDNSDLFLFLFRLFIEIDDYYVLERILASGYGYLLRTLDLDALERFSREVSALFQRRQPPTNLLIRDYARQIVELAARHNCYSGEVLLEHCRPPYKSTRPTFNVSRPSLEQRSRKANDSKILLSCSAGGDFQRYNIEPRLSNFIRIPLTTKLKPDVDSVRKKLEEEDYTYNSSLRKSYQAKRLRFNSDKAGYWVGSATLGFGWTDELFPEDGYIEYSRMPEGLDIERVGKKYQKLALSELLARLGDHYYILKDYSNESFTIYNYPNSIGFERDVDPSIFRHDTFDSSKPNQMFYLKPPSIEEVATSSERLDWPFQCNVAELLQNRVQIASDTEGEWTRVSWFVLTKIKSESERETVCGLLREEYFFIHTFVLNKDKFSEVKNLISNSSHFNQNDYLFPSYDWQPYMYEYDKVPNRFKVIDGRPYKESRKYLCNVSMAVEEYLWSDELGLPENDNRSILTLSPTLFEQYSLRISPENKNHIINESNELVGQYIFENSENHGFIMKTRFLKNMLCSKRQKLVTVLIGDRQAWPSDKTNGYSNFRKSFAFYEGFHPVKAFHTSNKDQKQ